MDLLAAFVSCDMLKSAVLLYPQLDSVLATTLHLLISLIAMLCKV